MILIIEQVPGDGRDVGEGASLYLHVHVVTRQEMRVEVVVLEADVDVQGLRVTIDPGLFSSDPALLRLPALLLGVNGRARPPGEVDGLALLHEQRNRDHEVGGIAQAEERLARADNRPRDDAFRADIAAERRADRVLRQPDLLVLHLVVLPDDVLRADLDLLLGIGDLGQLGDPVIDVQRVEVVEPLPPDLRIVQLELRQNRSHRVEEVRAQGVQLVLHVRRVDLNHHVPLTDVGPFFQVVLGEGHPTRHLGHDVQRTFGLDHTVALQREGHVAEGEPPGLYHPGLRLRSPFVGLLLRRAQGLHRDGAHHQDERHSGVLQYLLHTCHFVPRGTLIERFRFLAMAVFGCPGGPAGRASHAPATS